MIGLPVKNYIEDGDRPWLFGECEKCPLAPAHVVRSWGTTKSGIVIVGESPGQAEQLKGRPFIGPSGQLIRTILNKLGQNPDEVYWTNAMLCHAATPTKESIISCNSRLREELSAVGAKKVLLLGAIALQSMVSPSRATSIIANRGKGFWIDLNGRNVYALAAFHPAAVLRDSELFRDLVFDVGKFLKNDAPIEPLSPHTFISWTTSQAIRRLPLLFEASRVSCDIETTGLSSAVDKVVSIGFGVKRLDGEIECHIIPAHVFADAEVKGIIYKILSEYQGKLIFHNGKFDMKMLSVLYKETLHPVNFVDTMLMHYILDERAVEESTRGRKAAMVLSRHGLKVLVHLEYDEEYGWDWKAWNDLSPKTKEHWEQFFYYQAKDCAYTLDLEERYDKKLSSKQRRQLENLIYPASKALQDIENHGAPVDMEYLTKLEIEVAEQIRQLRIRMRKMIRIETGIRDWSTDAQKLIEEKRLARDPGYEVVIRFFNAKSYYHVKRLVYTIWKTPYQVSMTHQAKLRRKQGKEYWSTDDITLTKLAEKEGNPIRAEIFRCIIEYRALTQKYAKDIVGLIALVELGRVRTNFLLHGTVTGRLSSRNPNLQNIPVRTDKTIPTAFRAAEGWSIIEADYSQLEIRVLAEFCQDENLLRACATEDIHGDIASRVFGKPPGDISDFERKLTKTMVFGTLYGRSAQGILKGEEMGELVKRGMNRWTEDQANAFISRLFSLYPGMNTLFKRLKSDAISKHYVEYSLGRRRRFPFISDTSREEILRQAVNAPIQGTASDICLDGLVRLHDLFQRRQGNAHILLTVHDSILCEARNETISEILPLIRNTMEDVRLLTPTHTFKVKIKVGPTWGDVKEVA